MKVERINDNKIRCILTGSDLSSREIMLSELAYGSPKAKALFRDMMDLAAEELGFETDDMPIMVEAVPLEGGSLVLTISKVDNPEELDARFSRFSPASDDAPGDGPSGQNDMPDPFSAWQEAHEFDIDEESHSADGLFTASSDDFAVFSFSSLSVISEMSRRLGADSMCRNMLYKNPRTGSYFLTVFCDEGTSSAYTELCRLACEYGTSLSTSSRQGFLLHMKEHYVPLIKDQAVQKLRSL